MIRALSASNQQDNETMMKFNEFVTFYFLIFHLKYKVFMQNPEKSCSLLSSRTLTTKSTREDLRDGFLRTYRATEELFNLLASD